MDGAHSMNGEEEKVIQGLGGQARENEIICKQKIRLEDHIKTDL
jgi:hypothetical protein